jgi:hypothetical protein
MPLNRDTSGNDKNKRYIKENDINGAIVNAILSVIPDEILEELEYKIKNAYSPFALVDKVARVIRENLDEIVDLATDHLRLLYRISDRGDELYYFDTLEKREVPFDVSLTTSEYRKKGREPVSMLLEKSKKFFREVFEEDDLAEAFAHVFIDFITTPDEYIFDRFTTEYEKEQAERRMRGFEERTRRYRKKRLYEREPTDEELKKIEELGDIDRLSEEDLFTIDTLEDDFDDDDGGPWDDFPI